MGKTNKPEGEEAGRQRRQMTKKVEGEEAGRQKTKKIEHIEDGR